MVENSFPPEIVSWMMSLTPARILGRDREIGILTAGKYVDLLVIDWDFRMQKVHVHGTKVFDVRVSAR